MGQKDLDLAPDPQSGFEMVMLRMLTFRPVMLEQSPVKPVQIHQAITKPQIKASQPDVETFHRTEFSVDAGEGDWLSMIIAMKLTGPTREFANNCVLENIDDKVCTLIVDPGYIRGAELKKPCKKHYKPIGVNRLNWS